MKKHKKLNREEAKELFEMGITIESKHVPVGDRGRAFSSAYGWGILEEGDSPMLLEDDSFADFYRVQVE